MPQMPSLFKILIGLTEGNLLPVAMYGPLRYIVRCDCLESYLSNWFGFMNGPIEGARTNIKQLVLRQSYPPLPSDRANSVIGTIVIPKSVGFPSSPPRAVSGAVLR